MATATATRHRHGPQAGKVQPGHLMGVMQMKKRKFGPGRTAWYAFMDWMKDIIGRTCAVQDLTDAEAVLLIEAMKRLPDVPEPGQGELGL